MRRYDKNADPIKQLMSKKQKIAPQGKAKNQAINSRLMQVVNGAGVCLFGMTCGPKYPLFEYLNAATGWNLPDEEYMKIGERIETIRHAFNLREGIGYNKTRMSDRARGVPPMAGGPHAGVTIDFETMARDFYREMGWDFETGKPDKARLESLGLEEVLKDIYG
jgi:aldehyde:ferredoxin oxidoreductase